MRLPPVLGTGGPRVSLRLSGRSLRCESVANPAGHMVGLTAEQGQGPGEQPTEAMAVHSLSSRAPGLTCVHCRC